MLNEIFGKSPQIKVLDYLIAHPFHSYTKQQIAVGSGISRTTLDDFIDQYIENDLLIYNDRRYELNKKSKIIKFLYQIQHESSMNELEKQSKSFDEKTDKEIENRFETNVSDVNLDK
ncbi:hypothetical protein ALNOE001_07430 [Candidatus Methanobinarius endosymbioticus]|uniref:Uncharacterized protein n=1 Tax=Candidatus Methanobinarius endosymbioticus TaxID=2006182 RepID=A0A366MDL8_9EURY|nr:hypothetical protein ALNOE001_07430 [Candidatus Methanobinarius endosymbioticus]